VAESYPMYLYSSDLWEFFVIYGTEISRQWAGLLSWLPHKYLFFVFGNKSENEELMVCVFKLQLLSDHPVICIICLKYIMYNLFKL